MLTCGTEFELEEKDKKTLEDAMEILSRLYETYESDRKRKDYDGYAYIGNSSIMAREMEDSVNVIQAVIDNLDIDYNRVKYNWKRIY